MIEGGAWPDGPRPPRRPGLVIDSGYFVNQKTSASETVRLERDHRAGPHGLSMANQIMASISAQKNPSRTWAW